MAPTNATSAPAGPDLTALGIEREILIEGVARGVERAIGGIVREEFRAFLEQYFGCMDKAETAAYLGASERTIEQLWHDRKIPKDTLLGERMPRTWLPELKELLATSRIKVRESAHLRTVKKAA